VYRHFIEDLLRYSETLDAQCFEIDLAIEHALAEIVSASSLQDVHDKRGDADGDEKDSEDNDEEDP
jgi:hypothetical protein